MNVTIKSNEIRIHGSNGVDLVIYTLPSNEGTDTFSLSLCYGGFEHGVLPTIEVHKNRDIVVTNNLKTGRYLLNDRED